MRRCPEKDVCDQNNSECRTLEMQYGKIAPMLICNCFLSSPASDNSCSCPGPLACSRKTNRLWACAASHQRFVAFGASSRHKPTQFGNLFAATQPRAIESTASTPVRPAQP